MLHPSYISMSYEGLLQGLANVVMYLDDILVMGVNDEEHIRVLVEVLKRMKQSELIVRWLSINF